MAKTVFDEENCKGCGLCVAVCPRKIIVLRQDKLNSKGFHPAGVDRHGPVHRMHDLRDDLSGQCHRSLALGG